MKSEIRSHILYHWWKYALLAIIPIIVWVYLFGVFATPHANQTIKLVYVGGNLLNEELKSDIESWLPTISGEQNIKEVGIECLTATDDYTLSTVLAIRVTDDTDFVIMQGSRLEGFDVAAYFVPLSEELTASFADVKTYEKDNVDFGICLNSTGTVFSEYYEGAESCYLFVTSVSVNFGGLNGTGKPKDKVCLELVKKLLEAQ